MPVRMDATKEYRPSGALVKARPVRQAYGVRDGNSRHCEPNHAETYYQPNSPRQDDTLWPMRIRSDQGADEHPARRHDRRRGAAPGTEDTGTDGARRIGSHRSGGGQARGRGADQEDRLDDGGSWASLGSDRSFPPAAPQGGQASYWQGLTAGGAAGKGPVRGYPPMPGQPPPMYPPGQFAAWNRGPDGAGQSAQPARPGQAAGRPPGAGGPQARQQGSRPLGGAGPDSSAGFDDRYDDAAPSQDSDPSYPMLAVSDPAADVTSTQTWRAVEDGRATGVWTAPAIPGGGPTGRSGRHGSPAGGTPRDAMSLPVRERAGDPVADVDSGGRDSWAPPAPPAGRPDPARSDSGIRRTDGAPAGDLPRRVVRGQHSGARTGPRPVQPAERGASAAPARTDSANGSPATTRPGTTSPDTTRPGSGRPGSSRPGSSRPEGRRSASKRRAKRPASVKLAIGTALLLVLAAVGALGYAVLHTAAPKPHPAAAAHPKATVSSSPSGSPSPTLGPNGLIASRKSDPEPLTAAQLFPSSFKIGSTTVSLVASRISRNCTNAVDGSNLQARVSVDGCDQAVRATYVDAGKGVMGTIGVLNINTAFGAKKVAKMADGGDFVAQVTSAHGPAHKIGQGTGIEEAAAKGHYLILIWAEFTSLDKPKTAAERSEIEAFMTELLEKTANVSLTNRMLTGSP